MATTKRKYAGIRYSNTQDGGEIVEIDFLIEEDDPIAAGSDSVLPKIGDVCDEDGIPKDTLYCSSIQSRPVSDTNEKKQVVTVVYQERRPFSLQVQRNIPAVEWDIGLLSKRELYSYAGKLVGSSRFAEADGTFNNANGIPPRLDSEGELGYDRLIQTLDAIVRVPISLGWNPLVAQAIAGHVNQNPYSIEGTTFPVGTLLFLGASASPIGANPKDKQVLYRFSAGYTRLVGSLPFYTEDTNTLFTVPGGGTLLPIRYSAWPRFFDSRPAGITDLTVYTRKIVGLSIFEAFPEASFSQIGIPW